MRTRIAIDTTKGIRGVNDRPLIAPDEAARIIGIPKQSVIEAYRKGAIKGYKMGEGLRSPLALYRAHHGNIRSSTARTARTEERAEEIELTQKLQRINVDA